MKLFPDGHATHPQWLMAANLVLAQLRTRLALPDYVQSPTLGLLYITDYYAAHAQNILDHLSAELPGVTDWSGTVGVGIAANNVEYFDEPALAVMLCELPHDQYRVFSGVSPLPNHGIGRFQAHTALVHADASTPDVTELIAELAQRTDSGYVFGGLASSRSRTVQFALSGHGNVRGQGAANGVFSGGLSGVAFAADASDTGAAMRLLSRISQGCQALTQDYQITACEDNVVTGLDGQPALPLMLAALDIATHFSKGQGLPPALMEKLKRTLVGLSEGLQASDTAAQQQRGQFGAEVRVRHLIGLDPVRQGIAIADQPLVGSYLRFCERHVAAARSDLVRICTEIREELAPHELLTPDVDALGTTLTERRMVGAVYISCAGRGGPHFGAASAELHIVRRALGDVPLVGFFAGGEIAGQHVYGYTGVLTVFTVPAVS